MSGYLQGKDMTGGDQKAATAPAAPVVTKAVTHPVVIL